MTIGGIVLNHSQYMRTCPPVYRNKVLLKHSHGRLLACIHSTMAVLRVATERTFTIRSGEMARSGKVLATQSGYLSGRRELTFASCCLSSMHTVTFTPMYVHACTHVCTHTYTSKYNLKDSLFGIFFENLVNSHSRCWRHSREQSRSKLLPHGAPSPRASEIHKWLC